MFNLSYLCFVILLFCISWTNTAVADQVTDIHTDSLWLLDSNGDELEELSKKALSALKKARSSEGGPGGYFDILDENKDLALLKIRYKDKEVWIENFAVKTDRTNDKQCTEAEIALGQRTQSDFAGSIGFGGICGEGDNP